jgi:hypothetical protein
MLTLPWLIIMLVHGPRFWKWLLIPGSLYVIEKILRYRKSRSNKHGETFIMEAILLPSQVFLHENLISFIHIHFFFFIGYSFSY